MASCCSVQTGNLDHDLYEKLTSSKVLVVGAGGIGCELLKTLVLTGFNDIQVIDLDTIDVSNLNRQFLFQKQHVGKSKASVARESAVQFNPKAKIKAYHDSVTSPDYDVEFFRQFSVVLNALDNRAARNHVNRMCLAANVPLVESGSAGYLGQVTVIQKGETECYECQPKPHQKSYPGCTIRNTPSEPIHCIVWAKHLFNQLFGEADADEEVSPDTEDPEAGGVAGERATTSSTTDELKRTSTQEWAKKIEYEPSKLMNKLFVEDVKYLLSMDKLWKERKPPVPLDLRNLDEEVILNDTLCLSDQKIWSIKECVEKFKNCVEELKNKLSLATKGDYLVWDKDDKASLDFVVSACNIRAHIFSIQRKSRFDVKSMAGNIIPAIATTNAVISGLIVLEAMKALSGKIGSCHTTYLNKMPSIRKKLLQPSKLISPNPKCYVCSSKPEATVLMDCSKITVKVLEEKLLKQEFGVIAPDVEIEDGKGTILISSEEGETEQNHSKLLKDFKIGNGSRLKIDDFLQNYELVVNIQQCDNMPDDQEFKIVQDIEKKATTPENMEISSQKDGTSILERKRKASESLDDGGTAKRKQARVDVTILDGLVQNSGRNHVQDSGKAESTNRNAEHVVMVIDDVNDVTAGNSRNDTKTKNKSISPNTNADDSSVVVILDDETENQKHSFNGCSGTKHVPDIVIDGEDNISDDVIIL